MTNLTGIQIYDEHNTSIGILWQHLDADEAQATLDEEGIYALTGWSGDWESHSDAAPADAHHYPHRTIPGSYTYRLVTREAEAGS